MTNLSRASALIDEAHERLGWRAPLFAVSETHLTVDGEAVPLDDLTALRLAVHAATERHLDGAMAGTRESLLARSAALRASVIGVQSVLDEHGVDSQLVGEVLHVGSEAADLADFIVRDEISHSWIVDDVQLALEVARVVRGAAGDALVDAVLDDVRPGRYGGVDGAYLE